MNNAHDSWERFLNPELDTQIADQETKLKQQKKQLLARQALTKAQEKMRDASAPLSVQS